MKRSSSENLGKKWKQDDVVEAEILTVGGKVQFGDIKIDGKPTGAANTSQIGDTWSNGEYAELVVALFNPRSRAQFTKRESAQIADREALVYDYKIEEEHSQWNVRVNGRLAIPAYHGKVFIDVENGRVLRIDNEATYLPYDFPLSSAAGVMHYGEFEIDGQSYLLPARAVNKMCQRGSPVCKQLEIEFLDYRKFTSGSTLFTTDSEIEFGREVPDRPEPQPSKVNSGYPGEPCIWGRPEWALRGTSVSGNQRSPANLAREVVRQFAEQRGLAVARQPYN